MKLERNVTLAPFTTLRIGGPAEYFTRVHTVDALREALQYSSERTMPAFIIGEGSNVLVPDDGIPGLVIKNEIDGIAFDTQSDGSVIATVGAGVSWDAIVDAANAKGLWGIENLAGIPGTAGAAPIQNIGAYGCEIKDTLVDVHAIDTRTNTHVTLDAAACGLGYRDSVFKQTPDAYAVTAIRIRLHAKGTPNISYKDLARHFAGVSPQTLTPALISRAVRRIRDTKFPPATRRNAQTNYIGTAGSFFKNPIVSEAALATLVQNHKTVPYYPAGAGAYKIAAAWCIETAGFPRGYTDRSVGLWDNHALVLVAYENACANDVEMFANTIAQRVHDVLGIALVREVTSMQ